VIETGTFPGMLYAGRALGGADAVGQVALATARGKEAIKVSTQILQIEASATNFTERRFNSLASGSLNQDRVEVLAT
jgi:hypothetical protein